jgi:hypothetical protein
VNEGITKEGINDENANLNAREEVSAQNPKDQEKASNEVASVPN